MTADLRAPGTGSGDPGPPGPPGGEYVHTQDAPSTLWLVGHGLGMFPNVTVVDTLMREVEAVVQYIDDDNLTIAFAVVATGQAFLS